jgi:hypothetical protein
MLLRRDLGIIYPQGSMPSPSIPIVSMTETMDV